MFGENKKTNERHKNLLEVIESLNMKDFNKILNINYRKYEFMKFSFIIILLKKAKQINKHSHVFDVIIKKINTSIISNDDIYKLKNAAGINWMGMYNLFHKQ